MTRHLAPDEFIAALETAPDAAAAAHLAACDSCRQQLAALGEQWQRLSHAEIPEPSPLFWEHFSARVRAATSGSAPVGESWWTRGRLFWGAGLTAAAVLVLVLQWPAPEVPAATGASRSATEPVATVAFDEVAGVFEAMDVDEVEAFAPVASTSWVMVDELSDDERAVFVRLIEQQLEAVR